MSSVWLVATGDYEDYHVVLVAASFDGAVAAVQRPHGSPPYRVQWSIDDHELVGVFEAVPGFSTAHTARFEITEWQIEEQ